MHPPNDEELQMFGRMKRENPAFETFCNKQRAACLDALEQGASDLVRGQSITYREILKYLNHNPTR